MNKILNPSSPEQVVYLIGDCTMEKVFKPSGLTNLADLQAVFDAVEIALTPPPVSHVVTELEWVKTGFWHPQGLIIRISQTPFGAYKIIQGTKDEHKVTFGDVPFSGVMKTIKDATKWAQDDYARRIASALMPSPQTKSVLGSIVGPEALTPCAEPLGENISEIGASEGRETGDSSLTALFDNLGSARVAEDTGIAFHNGLRTEARAQASPSRREIGDEAHVEQMPEEETPEATEKEKNGRPTTNGSQPPCAIVEGVADDEDLIKGRSLRRDCVEPSPQNNVVAPTVDDIAEVLFSQRGTRYRWERAIDADPQSDEGTLVSIARDDARAVLSLFSGRKD